MKTTARIAFYGTPDGFRYYATVSGGRRIESGTAHEHHPTGVIDPEKHPDPRGSFLAVLEVELEVAHWAGLVRRLAAGFEPERGDAAWAAVRLAQAAAALDAWVQLRDHLRVAP